MLASAYTLTASSVPLARTKDRACVTCIVINSLNDPLYITLIMCYWTGVGAVHAFHLRQEYIKDSDRNNAKRYNLLAEPLQHREQVPMKIITPANIKYSSVKLLVDIKPTLQQQATPDT